MIPVVLLGGSITIIGVLARVRKIRIGKKTSLTQNLDLKFGYICHENFVSFFFLYSLEYTKKDTNSAL